jgi:cell filamentation protein
MVLRNRYGITDPIQLQALEGILTRAKSSERLQNLPMTPRGLHAAHKHLFEDLYEWAGKPRTIDMQLTDRHGLTIARFESAHRITSALQLIFHELTRDGKLVETPVDRFAGRAAYYIAEINRVHPYRDGNGRTMRFFLRELSAQAGHRLELKLLDPSRWISASIASHSMSRSHRPMADLIRQAITGKT